MFLVHASMSDQFFCCLGLILFLFISGCSKEDTDIDWMQVRDSDKATVAPDWKEPNYLLISELGWIESIHSSPDGKTLWYMYYKGKDLRTDAMTGNYVEADVDIYLSIQDGNGNFAKHNILKNPTIASDNRSAASGTMVDDDDNVWYSSNHEALKTNDWDTENIYRNNELLQFNDSSVTYGNPHYCKEKDELWFDGIMDRQIWVLKEASKNNFSGTPEIAPLPINSIGKDITNSQAWLSKDGNTMYFTSNRHKVGEYYDGPGIFKSLRSGNDMWSEPELVVSSKVAIGDPCLNEQENKLFFVQYFEKDNQYRTGVFYTTLR